MPLPFLRTLADLDLTHQERAVALLWLYNREDPQKQLTVREILLDFEAAGYTRPHPTRLDRALRNDRRVISARGRFRVNVRAMADLTATYGPHTEPAPPPPTDSVVAAALFGPARRTYIHKIVYQVNASYDATLYDCTAVMIRRLVETLIIELYEAKQREAELKDGDGNYKMLAGLLGVVDADATLNLSRNTKQGLRSLKRLGDLSAHSRTYTARKTDIDPIKADLRVVAEELLHLAGLI